MHPEEEKAGYADEAVSGGRRDVLPPPASRNLGTEVDSVKRPLICPRILRKRPVWSSVDGSWVSVCSGLWMPLEVEEL